MPRQIPDHELLQVHETVRRFPAGVSIDQLAASLGVRVQRRTLQRRLALLVARGDLRREGGGRGSRYLPSSSAGVAEPEASYPVGGGAAEVRIPISAAAASLRERVRRSLNQRSPVGYHKAFLTSYEPSRSFYLPAHVRAHLRRIGQASAEAQPAGTFVLRIFQRLLIDLSWNSSRLEGNTYSLLETERLLALGASAEGKGARDTQMILNHKGAIELLVESAAEIGFNSYTICNLHALLAENLLPEPAAEGRLRASPVGIGGSVYRPLEGGAELPTIFAELLAKASLIADPFEQAFFAMVHLPYLQAFDDVNKRVSRLAANIPLIRQNLCPLSFVDVPERAYVDGLLGVYELNDISLLRDVFVWAYERSCGRYSAVRQSLGEPDPFRMRYRDDLKRLVTAIVIGGMDKSAAVAAIRAEAAVAVVAADRARFIEIAETELMGLHAGNIARYRIRPAQFEAWLSTWA